MASSGGKSLAVGHISGFQIDPNTDISIYWKGRNEPMELTLCGHADRYAVEQLMLTLFPQTEGTARSTLSRGKTYLTAGASITVNGKTSRGFRRIRAAEESVRLRRRILQQAFYAAALPLLPEKPAWGALAGVRPTKITTKYMAEGHSPREADRLLRDVYYVTPARRRLAVDCSEATLRAQTLLEPRDISLYVGIPFCPTRCAYCSFVSRGIGKKTELMEPYLAALRREISGTAALLRASGRRVRTVYIGGGTPTTLSAGQLRLLLADLHRELDLSDCLEFTVEAGRPDTLDPDKLRALREGGADRISINPQSMVDSVLRASARPHRAEDIRRCCGEAVDAGFSLINMDLIAGLPTDTREGFLYSLRETAALAPANLTVHTLALKKGADLMEKQEDLLPPGEISGILNDTEAFLRGLGYHPYYLYRQKYMSGSFENVGWSKPGTDCLYNIYMMEEVHSILSLGGGGMTKINLPDGKILRFHNSKFPEQYLATLDAALEQKRELFEKYL